MAKIIDMGLTQPMNDVTNWHWKYMVTFQVGVQGCIEKQNFPSCVKVLKCYSRRIYVDPGDCKEKAGSSNVIDFLQSFFKRNTPLSIQMDGMMKVVGTPYVPESESLLRRFGVAVKDPWHLVGPYSVHADVAWNRSIDGSNGQISIAIIDSGIEQDAVTGGYFEKPVLPGYDFCSDPMYCKDGDGRDPDSSDPCGPILWVQSNQVYYSHGTACALLAAGKRRLNPISGEITQGPANGTSILPLRVLSCGTGWDSDIVDAIIYAAGGNIDGIGRLEKPVSAISLSLGSEYPTKCSEIMQGAINFAKQQSIPVFVAAGNEMSNSEYFSPSNCDNVIVVGASSYKGDLAYDYSNVNFHIAAPGGDMENPIKVNMPVLGQEKTAMWSGTSMSTPIAAATFLLGQEMTGNDFLNNPMTTPWDVDQNYTQCMSNGIVSLDGEFIAMSKCKPHVCPVVSLDSVYMPFHQYTYGVSYRAYDTYRMYPSTVTFTFVAFFVFFVTFVIFCMYSVDDDRRNLKRDSNSKTPNDLGEGDETPLLGNVGNDSKISVFKII